VHIGDTRSAPRQSPALDRAEGPRSRLAGCTQQPGCRDSYEAGPARGDAVALVISTPNSPCVLAITWGGQLPAFTTARP